MQALKGAPFDKRLVSQTYDGLRVEPLYPRAGGRKPVAGREPGAAWTVMQRIDHPDPTAANKQALDDLENGATGLTLVFAGSLNANGYGLDASPETIARVLDGVDARCRHHDRFQSQPADAHRRAAFRRAASKARKISPASVDMRASINPIGGFAATGTSPQPWSELSKNIRRHDTRPSPIKAFAGRSRSPTAASSTMPAARKRRNWPLRLPPRSIACARSRPAALPLDAARGMIYFRLAADADQFLTIAKFRALRKLWARVEASLRPDAEAGHRRGRNRLADDDAGAILT